MGRFCDILLMLGLAGLTCASTMHEKSKNPLLRGAHVSHSCEHTFQEMCTSARVLPVDDCLVCAGNHQTELRKAGCQPQDINLLCKSAKPTPLVWPTKFAANGTESFPPHNASGLAFSFAYDLEYVDTKTGIKGAQRIYRAGGTLDETCRAVRPGASCTQLAVGGQRYMVFPDYCCRCCSWEHGCGPLSATWTEGAVYTGVRDVQGKQCDVYRIAAVEPVGNKTDSLSVRVSDGRLCELDTHSSEEKFIFDESTYTTRVDPELFALPDADCHEWCGPKYACAIQ